MIAGPRSDEKLDLATSLPFLAIHVGAVIGVAYTGVTVEYVLLALGSYLLRIWAVLVGYHRYFSHRSFKCGRGFQLFLAVLGTTALQKGPLWWAAHHRAHHRCSDTEADIHSPVVRGFYWAHVGWMLCAKYNATDETRIRDFLRYPELRWINEHHLVAPVVMFALVLGALGVEAFIWICLVGTVCGWHFLFSANSVTHMFGTRRFETLDNSRNNWLFAIILLGEGWHNNHHRYPSSARQGLAWWELDVGYYSILALRACGLVWGVRTPRNWRARPWSSEDD